MLIEKIVKYPITFAVLISLLLSSPFVMYYFSPKATADREQYNFEKDWINHASCTELKQYILEDIEGTQEHWFVGKAKDLHEWKCEK